LIEDNTTPRELDGSPSISIEKDGGPFLRHKRAGGGFNVSRQLVSGSVGLQKPRIQQQLTSDDGDDEQTPGVNPHQRGAIERIAADGSFLHRNLKPAKSAKDSSIKLPSI